MKKLLIAPAVLFSLSGCQLFVKDPPVLFRATHCTAPGVCSSVESARDYPEGFDFSYNAVDGLKFSPSKTSVDPALLEALRTQRALLDRLIINVPGVGGLAPEGN